MSFGKVVFYVSAENINISAKGAYIFISRLQPVLNCRSLLKLSSLDLLCICFFLLTSAGILVEK